MHMSRSVIVIVRAPPGVGTWDALAVDDVEHLTVGAHAHGIRPVPRRDQARNLRRARSERQNSDGILSAVGDIEPGLIGGQRQTVWSHTMEVSAWRHQRRRRDGAS